MIGDSSRMLACAQARAEQGEVREQELWVPLAYQGRANEKATQASFSLIQPGFVAHTR